MSRLLYSHVFFFPIPEGGMRSRGWEGDSPPIPKQISTCPSGRVEMVFPSARAGISESLFPALCAFLGFSGPLPYPGFTTSHRAEYELVGAIERAHPHTPKYPPHLETVTPSPPPGRKALIRFGGGCDCGGLVSPREPPQKIIRPLPLGAAKHPCV